MITRIEALNFRCLRYVDQSLDRFHVLVGPNASGKTTFLDVVSFLGRLLSEGLDRSIREITPDPRDLLFARSGSKFELAVEAHIPDGLRSEVAELDGIRYHVAIGIDAGSGRPAVLSESVALIASRARDCRVEQRRFPESSAIPENLPSAVCGQSRSVISRAVGSNVADFSAEPTGRESSEIGPFNLGSTRLAFANLPEDETRFPAATWFKGFLTEGIQKLVLDSQQMRLASPPRSAFAFSNRRRQPAVDHRRTEGHSAGTFSRLVRPPENLLDGSGRHSNR